MNRTAFAVAVLARIPLKLLFGFVVVSLIAHEWFPLSHYPLYANPGPRTWYVYVSDGEDRPIALRKFFRETTPVLKKLYVTRLRELPPDQAGQTVLGFIADTAMIDSAAPPATLRLWRVDLSSAHRDIVRQRSLVGEYRLR